MQSQKLAARRPEPAPSRPRIPLAACLLALVSQATFADAVVAADRSHQLSFSWPRPTPASACTLEDPSGPGANGGALRFPGTIDRSEVLGVACTVQVARRTFDARYRFCTVANVDAVPRERYACWVMYSPKQVTFLYSYLDDYYGAPACEFTCSLR